MVRTSRNTHSSLGDADMDLAPSNSFQHGQKLRFPLTDDYFPTIKFRPLEHRMYADRMQRNLGDALEKEYWYHKTAYQSVDETQWRLMKERKDMRVYKFTGTNVRDQNTNVLAVGSIRGTIEDVMNGVHNNYTEELQATTRFHGEGALDAAMLAVLERGTYQDPFHFSA
uniref:AlNc14C242G9491 protein n=1 Tax=Albugo laibachii Nc14 TaxID=890382 RepID=F0WT01_9STRA|nr:AlNc14C242G9491 [Albugo laibachii Nc14]|eukprot:CCA24486.1 AlNc14C242G9491 [Albugo laibachii Nc14]